jgi:hypothetical protein
MNIQDLLASIGRLGSNTKALIQAAVEPLITRIAAVEQSLTNAPQFAQQAVLCEAGQDTMTVPGGYLPGQFMLFNLAAVDDTSSGVTVEVYQPVLNSALVATNGTTIKLPYTVTADTYFIFFGPQPA